MQNAAYELGVDPADFRKQNFIKPEQFPYKSATGFEYDSGDYQAAMDLALEKLGYDDLRREQEEARAEGKLIGIGLASFTEVVGAGHGADYDIAGLRMNDGAELRIHPTGKAVLKLSVKSQGQGHETTFAQIVAEELGLQPEDVEVQEGDTDNTPYGLGTYASRSTPVSGAATAMVSRRIRAKAQKIAAHLLEASEDDLEWENGRFVVKGAPEKSKTIADVAFAAYTNIPEGMEGGLEGVYYYDPPNMTYPFGTYAVVVEIDRGTGAWKVRRCVAVDDCGVRINPMIVEGQITGGLTEGFAIAAMQLIDFDEEGNCIGANFMDYLDPHRLGDAEVRARGDGDALAAPPARRQGRRRVGHGRRARRVRERRRGRARARRRPQPRDAGDVRQGLGGPPGGRAGRVTSTLVSPEHAHSQPCPGVRPLDMA